VAISNGARAAELLGVRGVDLDWGEQLVRVFRKGSDAEQWLPASPEAFVWIRLYLAELGALEPNEPLWWTLRRRDHGEGLRRQPMNYEHCGRYSGGSTHCWAPTIRCTTCVTLPRSG
jgi:integrase/recombinase XerD